MFQQAMADGYRQIRAHAELLSGAVGDLRQRAAVYHHIYVHSQRNHVFPLIAAHGALWGNSYFNLGIRLGLLVSKATADMEAREKKLSQLYRFADDFREINRQVCIEIYTAYYFSALYGDQPGAENFMDSSLLDSMNRCHHARLSGRHMTLEEKRRSYEDFFLWEQDNVVGPAVDEATLRFHWKAIKYPALKPWINFSYFPSCHRLIFKDFSSKRERIEKGFVAFEWAARVGWERVDESLFAYRVMPVEFHRDSQKYFLSLSSKLAVPVMVDVDL